jgi:ABC-type transport system substrate-binding protein
MISVGRGIRLLRAHWVMKIGLYLALAMLIISCRQIKTPDYLRIGLVAEPKTLHVWLASDRNSKKILSLIYQPLYTRDPLTLEQVPWLAAAPPVYNPKNISYTIKLRPARWSDGSEVTSADVAFTGRLIRSFKIPRRYSRWKFVKKIATPDKRTVVFYLKSPKAIFTTRTLTTPIVPRKQWQAIAKAAKKKEKPLAALLNYPITQPLGCGPFVLKEWRQGTYLHLKKNSHFFGTHTRIAGRTLGPYVTDLLFKVYGTSDVAILALKKGTIDMFWWPLQPGYINDLRNNKDIRLFSNEKSALYFMGFNLRHPPFNDVKLRHAMATLIDKKFITHRILQDQGTPMHSIVPAENQFWCCNDVPGYGDGLTREERVKRAFQILTSAGYTWDVPPVSSDGKVGMAKGFRLPNGKLMERFTILTPPADYDPLRAMSGMMIQQWFRSLGMPAFARPMAFGALLNKIKSQHDFDVFILGYGNLSLDPDYLRVFFYSKNDKPRGWNMSGYHSKDFDQIAKASRSAMDSEKRRQLIFRMQQLVMADIPYLPLYKPSVIEATRIGRFEGWVNMLEGIGNIWSFCEVKPVSARPRGVAE